jgi:preprotein translocase subunit SecG
MSILLIALHVIVCIALIMIVLLQTGKGADMGAAFGGGGSQTLFGSTGASGFLGKMTTGAAIVFMVTSLALAYVSSHRTPSSVISDTQTEAPAATQSKDTMPTAPPAGEDSSTAVPAPATTAEEASPESKK